MSKILDEKNFVAITGARKARDVAANRRQALAAERKRAACVEADAKSKAAALDELHEAKLDAAELRDRATENRTRLSVTGGVWSERDGRVLGASGALACAFLLLVTFGDCTSAALVGGLAFALSVAIDKIAKRVPPMFPKRGSPSALPHLLLVVVFTLALAGVGSFLCRGQDGTHAILALAPALIFAGVGTGLVIVNRRGLVAEYDLLRTVLELDRVNNRIAVLEERLRGGDIAVPQAPEPASAATSETRNHKVAVARSNGRVVKE